MIADAARTQIGAPYVWGGSVPATGFDCAGLVHWAYVEAGMEIPRYLPAMMDAGPSVEPEALQEGDLVFFENTYKRGLSHVGIVSSRGGERFIHAADYQWGVIESRMDNPYWTQHYAGAVRAWTEDLEASDDE